MKTKDKNSWLITLAVLLSVGTIAVHKFIMPLPNWLAICLTCAAAVSFIAYFLIGRPLK